MALNPVQKKTLLLGNAGGLSIQAIEAHFNYLDADYWNEFSVEEIREHLSALYDLSPAAPFMVRIDEHGLETFGLTLIGGNHPGFLAAVSGFIASLGYDIRSAKAFSFPPRPDLTVLPRGGIVDFLLLHREGFAQTHSDDWTRLTMELEGVFRRFESGDAQGVKLELYRRIGERLELRQGFKSRGFPLEIETHVLNTGTSITVRGVDREAMLFCISAALSLQGWYIEKLLTRLHEDGSFEDRLVVTGPGRVPLRDAKELKKIRVGIALMERLLEELPSSTNLQAAAEGLQKLVDDWLEETAALSNFGNLDVLPALARVLTAGPHLWQMVENAGPQAFRRMLIELSGETTRPTHTDFLSALDQLPQEDRETLFTAVRDFRRTEVVKAELDLLLTPTRDLNDFSARLSSLAIALLEFSFEHLRVDMEAHHGKPCASALFALGKFGGEELGAGSDLEILLVYEGAGETDGNDPLSHGEFYGRIVKNLQRALRTEPGETLSLDLRLRPHGESGPLAVSFSAWTDYFDSDSALDYEKQALIRLRFLHGDEELTEKVFKFRDEVTYSNPPVSIVHTLELHAQQIRLKTQAGSWNAKFSTGGMAELEYAVQFLQLLRGSEHPLVRQANLERALEALLETGVLTLAEFEHLYAAQIFLRRLINALRLVRGLAGDLHCPVPPSPEFSFLAKRLGYVRQGDVTAETQLERDIRQARRVVNGFFSHRFQGGERPDWLYESLSETLMDPEATLEEATPALMRLGMRDHFRALTLFRSLFAGLTEKRLAAACLLFFERRFRFNPDPEGVVQKLTRYLENLDHPDLFIRQSLHYPVLLDHLLALFANSESLSEFTIREAGRFKAWVQPEMLERSRMPEELRHLAVASLLDSNLGETPSERLGHFRNREYLVIALRDLRMDVPLREITHEISCLSDVLLQEALDIAIADIAAHGQAPPLCVLALGKLGGSELNYSSDIDLVFVAQDSVNGGDGREQCEKVGRRLIDLLTESNREGRLFRVDMNLRPWGTQGPLVGTYSQYRDYFSTTADGWELQAWLKARPVCGDLETGIRLVREVQRIACAPENLAKVEESMRKVRLMGLDKLHQQSLLTSEIKLGPGGIRTVEFYVQSLQIRHGAEMPELITGNTLEALGRLNRSGLVPSERFRLLNEAYVFLRRVEHRLQLKNMQQRHALPSNPFDLEQLARQMGFEDRVGISAVAVFQERYRRHMLSLQSVSAELFSH
jgi:glutamate-ammonia-ligase adenylyltransferase